MTTSKKFFIFSPLLGLSFLGCAGCGFSEQNSTNAAANFQNKTTYLLEENINTRTAPLSEHVPANLYTDLANYSQLHICNHNNQKFELNLLAEIELEKAHPVQAYFEQRNIIDGKVMDLIFEEFHAYSGTTQTGENSTVLSFLNDRIAPEFTNIARDDNAYNITFLSAEIAPSTRPHIFTCQ